jgi:hypothetical protein
MSSVLTPFCDMAVVALLALNGWAIAGAAGRDVTRAERAALAFPVGGATAAYVLFLLSWVRVPIHVATVCIVLGAAPAGIVAIWLARRGGLLPARRQWSPDLDWAGGHAFPAPVAVLGAAAALLVVLALVLSVGNAYAVWDSADIWASKGYGIAYEGSIFAAEQWGKHGLAYPLNIPLQISFFMTLGGDLAPGSKIIFTLFYASLLLGCFAFLRRNGAPPFLAGLCILLLGTTPVVFYQATVGYANLPMAVYVVLGSFWGLKAIRDSDRRAFVMSGILFGFSAWTRIEGVLLSTCAILALFAFRPSVWRSARSLMAWFAPAVAIAGPWFLFFYLHGRDSSQAMGALAQSLEAVRNGDLHVDALTTIAGFARRDLLNIENWGILVPAAVLSLILGWKELRRETGAEAAALLAVSVSTGIGVGLLFYVGSWVTRGLYGWLQRGFDREIFAPATLLFVSGILVLAPMFANRDRSLPSKNLEHEHEVV